MNKRGWKAHEEDVAEMFGLRQTTTSGNKFNDPGDGVTSPHAPYPIFADAKYTENSSISFRLLHLREWQDRAVEEGKHFILPIRFFLVGDAAPDDFVLLPAHDFAELLNQVNDNE